LKQIVYKEGCLAMTTAECLPLWIRIFDRMARLLPANADEHLEIAALRERITDGLAGDEGSIEDIEGRLHNFAVRHARLLASATDEVVGELFALVDPINSDLHRAYVTGTLNETDRASARGFIAALEACGARHKT
jgi:hypothetical protein